MGKAFKWLRGLLGALKKPETNPDPAPKKKWSFAIAKFHKEKDLHKPQQNVVPGGHSSSDARKHANSVVRLAGSGGGLSSAACVSQRGLGYGRREERAAITIQSHFRAYLSRRALRALKALVKLQALVRGHILRKQIADVLRQMQALARAQQRARAARLLIAEAPKLSTKSSHLKHTGPAAQEKVEQMLRAWSMKLGHNMMPKISVGKSSGSISIDPEKSDLSHGWVDRRMGERSWEQGCKDDTKNDKILVIDNGKPHAAPKRRNMFYSSELSYSPDQYGQSYSTSKDSTARRTTVSGEVQSSSPLKFGRDMDESTLCTAECSPQLCSASSVGGRAKRGAFTPTKSSGLRSRLSGYSDHPSYMAYTESSKAKVRSLSAPKQRPQHGRSSSINRYSVHGYGDSRPNTEKVSASHASFTNKAYPGSGHLDRLGMPMGGDFPGFNSGPWHRY